MDDRAVALFQPHPPVVGAPLGWGAVRTHMLQPIWSRRYFTQHVSQTLQVVTTLPHTVVPLSCPQLCGSMHLQLSVHSPAVCVPFESR